MSAIVAVPPVKPGDQSAPSAPPAAPAAVEFRYTQTESFPALLQQLGASLVITTYQAHKLLVARVAGAGLSMLVRTFDRPMGLAADGPRLALGTRKEVWFLRNAPDIAPRIEPAGRHDACFLPRSAHVTGDIGVHDLLNGLAVVEVRPRYVTALGETDRPNGWRANKSRGGRLIEISSGAVISRGL